MYFEKTKLDKTQFFNHETHGNEIKKLNDLIETHKIKYTSKDNPIEKIDGYLNIPKIANKNKKLPVIIYLRGGVAYFAKTTDMFASVFLSWLSSLGFVVITSNYRYKDECGGKEIEDILALKEILLMIEEADLNNINILATSRGGINIYQMLKNRIWNKILKKIIIVAGTIDVNDEYKLRPELKEFRSQFYDVTNIAENDKRSVIKWVNDLPNEMSNVTIIHGTDDVSVHYKHFLKLKSEVTKFNKNPNFITLENQGHGLVGKREIIQSILTKK